MRPYCTGEGELRRLGKMVHVRGRGRYAPARGGGPRGGSRARPPSGFPSRICSFAR